MLALTPPSFARWQAHSGSPVRTFGACIILALVGAAGLPTAQAARPMVTDDARIVDDRSCQLESWVRLPRDSGAELWALPGCNPLGSFELTLGGAHAWSGNVWSASDGPPAPAGWRTVAQVKTLFRKLETNDWGWGLALGTLGVRPDNAGSDRFSYFYVPVSWSFADDRVVVHLNGGGNYRHDSTGRVDATWGLGTEVLLTPRTYLIAEVYGQQRETSSLQVGVRHWVVKDRVQIDATLGGHFDGSFSRTSWISLGLRLLSPAFMPW
jgi:hypothetical protein